MKTGLILLLLLLVTILVVQNSAVVTLRFLFWETALSGVIVLLVTLLAGAVLGFALAKIKRGSRDPD